jgi:enoyl-CoA hydratase/carnithine racemase
MPEVAKLERLDAVAVLRLERPPVNALNLELIDALHEVDAEIEAELESD